MGKNKKVKTKRKNAFHRGMYGQKVEIALQTLGRKILHGKIF